MQLNIASFESDQIDIGCKNRDRNSPLETAEIRNEQLPQIHSPIQFKMVSDIFYKLNIGGMTVSTAGDVVKRLISL